MMIDLTPNSHGTKDMVGEANSLSTNAPLILRNMRAKRKKRRGLQEGNDCHEPAGSPGGGRFCSGGAIGGDIGPGGATVGGRQARSATGVMADPSVVAVHKGIKIKTLPGYMTPYYYAEHPRMGAGLNYGSLTALKRKMASRGVFKTNKPKREAPPNWRVKKVS